mmetsp:Transcript_9195/g.13878  ORF Transcript_9195/g.13878 Transcript_9195/m.13878 type:complete len:82 (-) Transcript_9195:248-493(-)
MQNAAMPVSIGEAIHEMKMFFVSSQLTDCIPLAAEANPMMHPITVWVVDTGMPMYVAIIIMKLADTRLVNIPNMTTSGISS